MPDREWFKIDGLVPEYPNLEAASEVAERKAQGSDQDVEIKRCTESVVRVYRRQVTVTAEDVTA